MCYFLRAWHSRAQTMHALAGAVVSTAFNPRMFHLPEPKANPDGPANGKENITFSDALTNVFATGGQDKRVVGEWMEGGEGKVHLVNLHEGTCQHDCRLFFSGFPVHASILTALLLIGGCSCQYQRAQKCDSQPGWAVASAGLRYVACIHVVALLWLAGCSVDCGAGAACVCWQGLFQEPGH